MQEGVLCIPPHVAHSTDASNTFGWCNVHASDGSTADVLRAGLQAVETTADGGNLVLAYSEKAAFCPNSDAC